jgi:hypothetical protein
VSYPYVELFDDINTSTTTTRTSPNEIRSEVHRHTPSFNGGRCPIAATAAVNVTVVVGLSWSCGHAVAVALL